MNALVLSGGGHRGAAHLGVLQAMQECGIEIAAVSGSSAGSIVGAMYAAGHSVRDTLELFKRTRLFSISTFGRRKPGLLNSDVFYDLLLEYFPEDRFEALDKKLFITASNLVTAQTKVFHEGRLINALLASSAVPGVFSPVTIEGQLYSDGGILDNFPVRPLRKRGYEIYGSYVCPIKQMEPEHFKRSLDVVNRAIILKMHALSLNKFKECKKVIVPQELCKYNLFHSAQIDKIYELGYTEAIKVLSQGLHSVQE